MNDQKQLMPGQDDQDQFHGQLIRMDEDAMLLPNSAVLDVIAIDDLRMRASQPAWLLGNVQWRGQDVPVLSMEALLGSEVPPRMRRSRIVIINSFGNNLPTGIFAVVSQGHPHLMTLNRVAVKLADSKDGATTDEHVACRVQIANAQALIPNLDALEATINAVPVDSAEVADQPWEPDLG